MSNGTEVWCPVKGGYCVSEVSSSRVFTVFCSEIHRNTFHGVANHSEQTYLRSTSSRDPLRVIVPIVKSNFGHKSNLLQSIVDWNSLRALLGHYQHLVVSNID